MLAPLLPVFLTYVLSFVCWIAQANYVLVALMWLVPDRRIENAMRRRNEPA